MADTSLKEFDQFRFVREDNGVLASLPSENEDEQVFMVLDCDRYRLARLHIFEGKSGDAQRAEWFRREMAAISKMQHPNLNPLITWGQDESELFYADQMVRGETVASYLKRNGAVPPATAAKLTLDLVSVLQSERALPRTLENFNGADLHVATGPAETAIRLVVSDFSNWDKPCVLHESELVVRVVSFFKQLLTGSINNRVVTAETGASKELLTFLDCNSNERSAVSMSELAGQLREFSSDVSGDQIVRPRSVFRNWLLRGSDTVDLGSEYKEAVPAMNGTWAPELAYAFDATLQGPVAFAPTRFQVFPGHETIPRSHWFEQHSAALRRPGRGFPNQLVVQSLEPRGRTLLIGEERIEGLNLYSIVQQLGPLSAPDALEMGSKLSAAIDAIERSTSSCPVWWLPPENIYVVTGSDQSDSLKEALDRFGSSAWGRLPMRLRLHQTAASLLDGIQLPKTLLERVDSARKTEDSARRTAVLCPILWFVLTGNRFSWTQPVEPVEGKVPEETAKLFEKARTQLQENPDSVHFNFLEELAGTLENFKSTPGLSTTPSSGSPGRTFLEEGISEVMEPVIGAKAPEPVESSPGQTFIDAPSDEPDESELGAEPESLGEIIDDSVWGEEETVSIPEAETESNAIQEEGADEIEDSPSDLEQVTEPQDEPEPEAEEIQSEKPPVIGEFDSAEESINDVVELEESADSEPASFTTSPEAENSIEIEEDKSEEAPIEEPESEAKAETVTIPDSELETQSSGPEEKEPAEPISETESGIVSESTGDTPELDPDSEPDTETEPEGPSIFVNPSRETAPKVQPESASGFGERLLAQAGADEDAPKKVNPWPWIKIIFLGILAAGLVFGATRLYTSLTDFFQKQDLIRLLPQTDYELKLTTANPLGNPEKSRGENAAIPPDETDITTGIEKASVAIQRGDTAQAEERHADAVNLYLHALSLEPASSEARTQLWKTLETWSKSKSPIGKINTDKLEQAAEYAPQAAWLLSEYYLPRDPALGLHWLKKSAEGGHPGDMRKLGIILAQGKLVPADHEKAVNWLEKAADKGDPKGQFFFGECLVFGKLVEDADPYRGVDYLKMASDLDNPQAKELLGVCLINGNGANVNRKVAFQLLRDSAALENTTANLQLGLCYIHGNGTGKDESAAFTSFQKGAELGDPKAMYIAGRCLEKGLGTKRSSSQASSWIEKAASLGHLDARAWCRERNIAWEEN
ncbi:MAG: hypothetical protein HKN23_18495 [Verrucomicrobiales bacterium]|nr:hypothetical protein [Verrucomicrobiales bacterium]